MSKDMFSYELDVPAVHTIKLTITKQQVIGELSKRLQRTITEKEANDIWERFQTSNDWYNTFPEDAMKRRGIRMYTADDYQNYCELFQESIQKVIQETGSYIFNELWERLFEEELYQIRRTLEQSPEESITLENVEQQTQKRIQDENVKHGLARCANETKKKSIEKWKEHYFQTHQPTE